MLATQTVPTAPQITAQANPTLIFETLNRFQHTMALKGAIELELFTHIASGAATPATLAPRCHASERGVRILCDFLTVMGFLRKNGQEYALTQETGPFLDRQSPLYMGPVANFMASPARVARYRDVAALVRKGGTIDGTGSIEADGETWVEFARSMPPVIMPAAQAMAAILSRPGQKQRVLDIAAGHGMFGISIAQKNPAAEVFALDWQPVLEVALENAARAGVQDRVHAIAGSVFEVDLGSDYDVVLITNFLHHFDAATNVVLLKRVRAALKPRGLVATLEFVPNDDRVSPPIPAAFSMVMLANTEHGDAHTFAELDGMFRQAGFGESRMQTVPPTPMSLILTAR
jgi:SAM-dependent methyltransferase